jgi:hypothetical protein
MTRIESSKDAIMRGNYWNCLQADGTDLQVNEPTLWIEPDKFCQLAVSSRPLVRCDDSAKGLKGLRDLETGEFFVVKALDLLAYNVTKA